MSVILRLAAARALDLGGCSLLRPPWCSVPPGADLEPKKILGSVQVGDPPLEGDAARAGHSKQVAVPGRRSRVAARSPDGMARIVSQPVSPQPAPAATSL
jgi:hypothetical protein